MALDVAGLHHEAEDAYEWLADAQRPDGSLAQLLLARRQRRGDQARHQRVRLHRHRRVAPLAVHVGPRLPRPPVADRRAGARLGAAAAPADGLVLWAVEADGTRPWDYALLTGSSSIQHALRCGRALADVVGEPRPEWDDAADAIVAAIAERPDAFEPKERWAMDWYYPVLTGALDGRGGQGPARRGLGRVRHGGPGHPLRQRRAVGDGVGDGRVRAGLRRDRRPGHGDRPAALDPRPPARRRLVLDRPRLRRTTASRCASRSRSTRRTPRPPSSSPPTPSPAPRRPRRCSPRALCWTDAVRTRSSTTRWPAPSSARGAGSCSASSSPCGCRWWPSSRLVTTPFDPGRYAAGWLFRRLAVVHQTAQPAVAFRVDGELPPDPRRPYVVVANHESFVDILLISHLPWEMKWLSKARVLQDPRRRLADAPGRRHPARPRRPRQRGGGDGRSAGDRLDANGCR